MASIERSVEFAAPAGDVWRAISDESMLRDWLAPEIELDPRPGGALRCRTEEGELRFGTVQLVEEGERLAFVWERQGAGPSRVELQLEELDGATRLTVVETGLEAQSSPRAASGWQQRLEALKTALADLAYA